MSNPGKSDPIFDNTERHLDEDHSPSLPREIWDFLKVRKKLWLAPIIFVLALLMFLILFASQNAALSPFLYAL